MYLHHRTTVRQRKEDETDKYKSMDFGLDGPVPGKGNKRRSAMFGKEKDPGHKVQLSMDLNLSSPYLLPPNMQNSRESLNSLAKSLHQNEDPYRPVTQYAGSDVASMRSIPKGANRNSSGRSSLGRDSTQNRPSIAISEYPPRQKSLPTSPLSPLPPAALPPQLREPVGALPPLPVKNEFRFVDDSTAMPQVPEIQEPVPAALISPSSSRPISNESARSNGGRGDSMTQGLGIMDTRASQSSVGSSPRNTGLRSANTPPPRNESLPAGPDFAIEFNNYAANIQLNGPDHEAAGNAGQQEHPLSAGLGVPAQDNRRLSVGLRPLPPDDFLESEDPEFRANRIRSFYKEYFEETKTDSGKPPPLPQNAAYHNDDSNYLGDTAFFDPDTNAFVMPYAQPVTRRAMTPPPRNRRPMPGPGPHGPNGHGPHGSMGMPGGPRGRSRAGSTSSHRWAPMSPRPDSSASNPRMPNGKPRKPMPPPAPLSTLPTPSKLRDDSFAILGAIDFAPPPTFKDVAAGRSQSPVGERKPYVLNTPIHSPLVSAFDDTPALPSP